MGLKGSGPFFQRSMPNNVLQGYVTRICEIYIDDVLLFGTTDDEYIDNTRKVLIQEKRLQVLDFPLPENETVLLQFIGLVNYFRDHVPHMTEMVQPLRKLIDIKKYKGSKKLTWTPESIEAFHFCRIAVSNCQELYFLEDTVTPILQTDASDYGIDE